MSAGDNIRKRRLALGLTLEEVAEKIGVSRQTMSRYETGIIKNLSPERWASLAEALDTSGSYLLGYIDDSSPEIQLTEEKAKALVGLYEQLRAAAFSFDHEHLNLENAKGYISKQPIITLLLEVVSDINFYHMLQEIDAYINVDSSHIDQYVETSRHVINRPPLELKTTEDLLGHIEVHLTGHLRRLCDSLRKKHLS